MRHIHDYFERRDGLMICYTSIDDERRVYYAN